MGPVPGCPGRAETRLLTRLLLPFVVGVLTASASPRATARDFVLNEVLPDPSGADDGREFVELLNPGPDPLALDGVRLEFANGADGPVWLVRWTAPDGLVVPAGGRFLLGDRPTEADWRLFTTLVRFDAVYHLHFKCNRRRLIDYPNLWPYTRNLYQWPTVAGTVHLDHIVRHYHYSHDTINPNRIIPINPILDFAAPHGRG